MNNFLSKKDVKDINISDINNLIFPIKIYNDIDLVYSDIKDIYLKKNKFNLFFEINKSDISINMLKNIIKFINNNNIKICQLSLPSYSKINFIIYKDIEIIKKYHESNIIEFGYTDKLSYNNNETIKLYTNTKEDYHFKWGFITNILRNHILDIIEIDINRNFSVKNTYILLENNKIVHDVPERGVGIKKFININISLLKSGIYFIDELVKIIVKDINNSIVVLYPSNTEIAYNKFGGKCGYYKWPIKKTEEKNINERADKLSFFRPNIPMFNNLTKNISQYNSEFYHMYGFLKLVYNNYDINYISDVDVENMDNFNNTKSFIIIGHNEYITLKSMKNINKLIKNGINFLSLSGNTFSFEVEYQQNCMVFIKDEKKNKRYLSRNDFNLSFLNNFGLDSNVWNSFPIYNYFDKYDNIKDKQLLLDVDNIKDKQLLLDVDNIKDKQLLLDVDNYNILDKNNILLNDVKSVNIYSQEYDAVILKGLQIWFKTRNNNSHNSNWMCNYFNILNKDYIKLDENNVLPSIIELNSFYDKFKNKKLIGVKKVRRLIKSEEIKNNNGDSYTGIIAIKENDTSGLIISFGCMNVCNIYNINNNKTLILNAINIILNNNIDIFI